MNECEIVDVALSSAPYQVFVGEGMLGRVGEVAREIGSWKRVCIVTDSNVGPLYAEQVKQSLLDHGFDPREVVVPAGEASKSFEQLEAVCDAMISAGCDRGSAVVALGGGVVGDLAGFAAAIYYRGVPVIQVPTTVMAQVDSSVGGKTGINARAGKNLIGSFHQPKAVIADPLTLQSLPEREYREGFAEIIKHAVIADAGMLDELDPGRCLGLVPLIARNVRIKARMVMADEFETTGQRALLNFGHTVGHAVEQACGYGRLLHGEAIAIGVHAALRLSTEKAGLSQSEADRVLEILRLFKLPVTMPDGIRVGDVLEAMKTDKKFTAGSVRFVLTPRLGEAYLSKDVSLDDIERVVQQIS